MIPTQLRPGTNEHREEEDRWRQREEGRNRYKGKRLRVEFRWSHYERRKGDEDWEIGLDRIELRV